MNAKWDGFILAVCAAGVVAIASSAGPAAPTASAAWAAPAPIASVAPGPTPEAGLALVKRAAFAAPREAEATVGDRSARRAVQICVGPARLTLGAAPPVRLRFGGEGCGDKNYAAFRMRVIKVAGAD